MHETSMIYEAMTLVGAAGLALLYATRPPALLLTLLLLGGGTTRAQSVDARAAAGRHDPDVDLARLAARTDPAVLLARMAWLEAGAHVAPGEVAAMHEVIVTRTPERGSYQRTAYQYSAALRNPTRASTHRLTRRPLGRGWPALHREHWPRVLAAADAAVAGTLRHGCTQSPLEHWGGPHVDRESIGRLERSGYTRAECPGYANAFLVRAP